MNRTAWIFVFIPLVMTLGCHSARVKEIATEPNMPLEEVCISIDSPVSNTEPNTLFEPDRFVLSGSLGIDDVTLMGLPGDPNSLTNGTYSVTVDAGWSGTVTPEKEGYVFSPASRSYEPFTQDIRHEIYVAQATVTDYGPTGPENAGLEPQPLTGILKLGGVPIQGITLRTLATSMTAVTDVNGFFMLSVPADWTGTLKLESPRSVSENPVVGPRASGFGTGKDGENSGSGATRTAKRCELTQEAGDIGVYRRYSRTQSSCKISRSKPDRILRQAPRTAKNDVCTKEAILECELEIGMDDIESAAETAPETLRTSKVPPQEEPLITLGTPSLSREATIELEHDLRIMCQLLSEEAFGISLVKGDPNSEPRPIYLPGEGALFNICLDWPLADQLPEPNAPEASVRWKTARESTRRQAASHGALEKLHQMKTQAFIERMTHCLVHAAHIRHLSDDDYITIHVWGPAPSGSLVIRARLKDINDYAEAVLTDETFEELVVLRLH